MITEKASAYVYRMVNSCVNSSIIYIFLGKNHAGHIRPLHGSFSTYPDPFLLRSIRLARSFNSSPR